MNDKLHYVGLQNTLRYFETTALEALGVVPETQWPSTEAMMHESSTDSEVTFRRGLGSAEVLTTRPGVDTLEVTRPLPDFSWTTQSPIATSPSVMVCPGMQPPAASHVFGPSTTQVEPETPHRTTPENPHRENLNPYTCYK